MLILLGVGAAVTLVREPGALRELADASLHFRLPAASAPAADWADVINMGAGFLAGLAVWWADRRGWTRT